MTTTTAGYLLGGSISASGWHGLGMALLTESFRWAAFGMTGATTMAFHNARINEARQFLFQGTNLDVALGTFGMELLPEDVRALYSRWLQQRHTPFHPQSTPESRS